MMPNQEFRLYLRDLFFFVLTCTVSVVIAEIFVFPGEHQQVQLRDRIFTYAVLIIPLTLVVMLLSYNYRTRRILKTGQIRSSIRYKLIVAFMFVSILPSIPIVLLSGDLINKSIDGFFSIDIKDGLQGANKIAQYHITREREIFIQKLPGIKLKVQGRSGPEILADLRENGLLTTGEYFALIRDGKIRYESFQALRDSYFGIEFQPLSLPGPDGLDPALRAKITEGAFSKDDLDYYVFRFQVNDNTQFLLGKTFGSILEEPLQALQRTHNSYRKAEYYREKVSVASQIGLVVTSLVLVLAAVGVSIILARQISEPLLRLALATRNITRGDLDQEIEFPAKGEMAILIESFNQMVISIRKYKEEINQTQRRTVWKEVAQRVAHEIKNPLTPIQLSAERLKRRMGKFRENQNPEELPELDEFTTKITQTILSEVAIIKRLVNEFSQFARMPTARLEKGQVADILRDVAASYNDTDGLDLTLDFETEIPPTLLDGDLLHQVFGNLVKNSIEAMTRPDGKLLPDARVIIRAGTRQPVMQESAIFITIEDNGPEVDPEVREKIFEPYFSTKKKGTGIGLAISEKIIIDHGGNITCVNSRSLRGLRFEILLPVREK